MKNFIFEYSRKPINRYRIKMKKFFLLFFTSSILRLIGLAQFPHCLMPGPVIGSVTYGDSLLNSRDILQKAGIKKIYTYHTSSEKLKTYQSQTSVINENGHVESVRTCFPKNEVNKDGWCVFDTVLYDDQGRIREIKNRDIKGYEYSQTLFEYISETELKFIQINKLQSKQRVDTLVDYRFFNKKGQMIKFWQIRKERPAESSLYYYNADGLLDSIQYESPHLPTIVYKRSVKGNNKIIEAQIQHSKFKWVFNQSGQCTSLEITTNFPPRTNYTGATKGETNYYYNPDGTLLKVSIKGNDKVKAAMHYTYSK